MDSQTMMPAVGETSYEALMTQAELGALSVLFPDNTGWAYARNDGELSRVYPGDYLQERGFVNNRGPECAYGENIFTHPNGTRVIVYYWIDQAVRVVCVTHDIKASETVIAGAEHEVLRLDFVVTPLSYTQQLGQDHLPKLPDGQCIVIMTGAKKPRSRTELNYEPAIDAMYTALFGPVTEIE